MARGRKPGFGSVVVGGRVMTQQDYKNAVVKSIKDLTSRKSVWVSANTIIEYAASNLLMEPKHRKRKANSHPAYRILSEMMETNALTRRVNARGEFEYRLA